MKNMSRTLWFNRSNKRSERQASPSMLRYVLGEQGIVIRIRTAKKLVRQMVRLKRAGKVNKRNSTPILKIIVYKRIRVDDSIEHSHYVVTTS